MGRVVNLSSNPLEPGCTRQDSFVVPDLPWDVRVHLDDETLGALADASRAIGRLDGSESSSEVTRN